MYTRRVQAIGDRSYVITLPKPWVMSNHVKAKTPLRINPTPNGDLLISKSADEKKTLKEVVLNVDEVRSLKERIVYCYIANSEKVKIISKKPLSYEVRSSTKKIVERLEGFKITDESPNSIEIQFIFKEVSITFPNLLRRMVYLLKLMHDALSQKDEETVMTSELSMDRLHHLSQRILYQCLLDAEARQVNEIQSKEEIFYFKDIVRRLEVISDRIVFIMRDRPEQRDVTYLGTLMNMLDRTIIKQEDDHEMRKEVLKLNFKAKDRALDIRLRRIYDLIVDVVTAVMDIRFSRQYNSSG